MYLCTGKSARPAPAELPQVRKEARVSGWAVRCWFATFFLLSIFPAKFFLFFTKFLKIYLRFVAANHKNQDMKFFVDTANLQEIQEAYDLGVLDGVTTNPSLMAKEGISGHDKVMAHYKAICDIVDGDISAEVIAVDFEGMVREGELLAELHPNIVVKVPMIKEGVKAIKYFSDKGIKTNCTLIFSAGQALLAAKAGATYVSPFVGRLDDVGTDGLQLIEQIVGIYANYGYQTEVLAASVRHVMHLIQCAEIGADVVTCPLNVITALLNHPLTDSGLAKFLADHKKVNI